MKIERGVMIMKDGKAWGILYADGRSTCYGWVSPEYATIHDPEFCRSPEDVTYKNSPYIKELRSGSLVMVKRTTTIEIEIMPPAPPQACA